MHTPPCAHPDTHGQRVCVREKMSQQQKSQNFCNLKLICWQSLCCSVLVVVDVIACTVAPTMCVLKSVDKARRNQVERGISPRILPSVNSLTFVTLLEGSLQVSDPLYKAEINWESCALLNILRYMNYMFYLSTWWVVLFYWKVCIVLVFHLCIFSIYLYLCLGLNSITLSQNNHFGIYYNQSRNSL